MKILGIPDKFSVETESGIEGDAKLRFEESDSSLCVYLSSNTEKPRFVRLTWYTETDTDALLLGDTWERSYGDLAWEILASKFVAPWYFLCQQDDDITAVGVKVRPNAFVSFTVTPTEISAMLDVRNGGSGVELGGRELLAAEFVGQKYSGSPYQALSDFCGVMCNDPILPNQPIYGGNNWYYAYGKSSKNEILNDALYQSELAGDAENRPFMVIDDGWQINPHMGPWVPNESFGDMTEIARQMKNIGVRPGIWVRFLDDKNNDIPLDWRLSGCEAAKGKLDPTIPQVKEYIASVIATIKKWGYELIKHDFTFYDVFGAYSFRFSNEKVGYDGWSFYDKTKTTAEILKELYKLILDCAGDTLILGCNTVSHLSAGLVHIYRTGDDTSGTDWQRVCKYGVNTLAFRLAQHKKFYAVDADCVGIKDIPWSDNVKWLELLAKSGTPLFVSLPKDSLDSEQFSIMQRAYERASKQEDVLIPIDWEENKVPEVWSVNGEINHFDWNYIEPRE